MSGVVVALLVGQGFYTIGDALARHYMGELKFTTRALSLWLIPFIGSRIGGNVAQLYVYALLSLSAGSLLFSIVSIFITPAVGIIVQKDPLTWRFVLGAALAVPASYLLLTSKQP